MAFCSGLELEKVCVRDGTIHLRIEGVLGDLKAANTLIDMLVKAKNEAFPSGAEEHRKRMEVTNETQADVSCS